MYFDCKPFDVSFISKYQNYCKYFSLKLKFLAGFMTNINMYKVKTNVVFLTSEFC